MKLKLIRNIALWSLLVIIILLIIARLGLPFVMQKGFTSWFEQQGVNAHIAEVDLDLINGQLSFRGIDAIKDGTQVFGLSTIFIEWSWQSLNENTALINALRLDGLDLEIVQRSDSSLIIAGVDLQKLSSHDEDEDPEKQQAEQSDDHPDDIHAADPVGWLAQLDELKLTDIDICYRSEKDSHFDNCSRLESFIWQGSIMYDASVDSTTDIPLFVDGSLSLDSLTIHSTMHDRDILRLAETSLDKIRVDTLDKITLDKLDLADLALLQRADSSPSPEVTAVAAVEISRLTLSNLASLHIVEIKLLEHDASILVGSDKQLEISKWLPQSESPDTQTEQSSSDFVFIIDSFIYESDRSLRYIDNSLADPFSVDINHNRLTVTDIDSSKPEQPSRLDYAAVYDEHGKITLKGKVTLFADRPSFDIDGTITGMDLRSISAFTKDAIGHTIKSGQLDAKLVLRADKSVLDSELDLTLQQFELKPLSKKDSDKLDTSFGFPLNTSLALLRDRDNSIRLTIPVTGDLQNPDFDPNDAINKATSKAITAAVINYYTPYGLVLAADSLFSLATALRFDPVMFPPGSSDLDVEARKAIDTTAQLLVERPGVRLTLCGYTNTLDRQTIYPDIKSPEDGKELILDKPQLAKLAALANKRSSTIKQLLIDNNIDASRLIQCEPVHEEGGELAGVEISI